MDLSDHCRDLTGYQWLSKEELEKKLVETISDKEYDSFLNAIERLSVMPYSYKVKDFLLDYCVPLLRQLRASEVPTPLYDPDGRAYVTTYGNINLLYIAFAYENLIIFQNV